MQIMWHWNGSYNLHWCDKPKSVWLHNLSDFNMMNEWKMINVFRLKVIRHLANNYNASVSLEAQKEKIEMSPHDVIFTTSSIPSNCSIHKWTIRFWRLPARNVSIINHRTQMVSCCEWLHHIQRTHFMGIVNVCVVFLRIIALYIFVHSEYPVIKRNYWVSIGNKRIKSICYLRFVTWLLTKSSSGREKKAHTSYVIVIELGAINAHDVEWTRHGNKRYQEKTNEWEKQRTKNFIWWAI